MNFLYPLITSSYLMKFIYVLSFLALLAQVHSASIIFCGVGKKLVGHAPGSKCGSDLGWESYYTTSSNKIVPGIWMRSSLSSSEKSKFAACCKAGGMNTYYENGVSETEWKSLARLSSLTGNAKTLVTSIISGLIVAAIAA
jgi:hypothetical protein